LDDNRIVVIRTHRVVPHVTLADSLNGGVGSSRHLDDRDHLDNARRLVDCRDIMTSWKSRAVERVEGSAKVEERKPSTEVPAHL